MYDRGKREDSTLWLGLLPVEFCNSFHNFEVLLHRNTDMRKAGIVVSIPHTFNPLCGSISAPHLSNNHVVNALTVW